MTRLFVLTGRGSPVRSGLASTIRAGNSLCWLLCSFRAAPRTKKATPHSLRHTFASYKARRGVTPYMLKEMLGHKNLTTTQLYAHLDKLDDQKVMEATSL